MASMTPETRAKIAITKMIHALLRPLSAAYSLRNTPAPMGIGKGGRPDMMLILNGHTIEIEVKSAVSRGKPTPLQEQWLRETFNAGGDAWVVWGDQETELGWLKDRLLEIYRGEGVPSLKLRRINAL